MPQRKRVLILGGGFAGLSAARALRRAPLDVTLIDRANHHVFQPLLYQTATAAVSPGDITAPIRWLLRKQRNTTVLLAEVTGIAIDERVVELGPSGDRLSYDWLIVATGARHSYFEHPEWESLAPGLKSVEDALEIRNRFLGAFERAERCEEPEERRAWLTFVIVGGGPTGVELAGVMPVIARRALAPDFRNIRAGDARVVLVEGGPRILPAFPERLSARAHRDLERLGVEVRTGETVCAIGDGRVTVRSRQVGASETIRAHTVFWAAGNTASSLGGALDAPLDRSGRVLVETDLSLPGRPEVLVAGDLAAIEHAGAWVPAVAPAANQQGAHAARCILADLRGEPRAPFRYRDKGNLATIGRHRAIADFGWLRLSGRIAWFFWLFVHVLYLAGFRNRLSVLLSWAYQYFTFQRGIRLITRSRR